MVSTQIGDTIFDIQVQDAQGRTRHLSEYRGDVLLIVNTASY
jgi:glutathione peroxidase-family protein